MKAADIVINAKKKVEKLLDDVNRILPQLRSVGLSIAGIDVDMGIFPGITVKMVGAVNSIDPVKVRHLRESNPDNKVLVGILRAVETAVNMKDVLRALSADTLEIEAKLGLFPNVSVRFLPSATSLTAMPQVLASAAETGAMPSQVASH
jgi:hypothetical protein